MLPDIHAARQVFQWRLARERALQKQEHTLELARALKDGRRFPPLTVYLIGEKFYVLDGHHRLDAYHTVGWTKPVPVTLFKGSFEDAWTHALQANSATKLPMTRDEKSEAAWKLIKTTSRTPDQMNALTGSSRSNLYIMKDVWKKLCAYIGTGEAQRAFGKHITSIEDMRVRLSWLKARTIAAGAKLKDDEEWRDQKAAELAEGTREGRLEVLKVSRHHRGCTEETRS